MTGRHVKVHLYDESTVSAGRKNTASERYKFYPKDLCIVEPDNPLKKKHRGRAGQLTGKMNASGKIGIRFLDTWTIGYVDARDLIPYKSSNNS